MGRAPCCDKANVKKGPWSTEEDAKLKAYIEKYGTGGNWIALPQKIGLKRCGKSCRLRWLNYLRPNIKHGGFSEEEDNIICNLYISIGSRWSIIAAQLPGRTDNDIKNYWNTKLKKKLLGRRKQSYISRSSQDPTDMNGADDAQQSQALSNSALERLQLHMQLQSLQNPFCNFSNNPALWPKLHPLQEKMLQNLQSLNGNPNTLLQPLPPIPNPEQEQPILSVTLQQDYSNGISSSDGSVPFVTENNLVANGIEQSNNAGIQPVSGFQGELDEFLINKTTVGNNFAQQEDQTAEFDCFKDMNGSKDSMVWWSNGGFDAKSASPNSWDSTSVLQTSEGIMFQDYELGYNM
ncbi:hypothetical protein SLA2020_518380 [Shorea laevis]